MGQDQKKPAARRRRLSPINAAAAGIDVGATFHVVAVPEDRCEESVRTFQTFTAELCALADWLAEVGAGRQLGISLRRLA